VQDIPYTINGKRVEVPVKKVSSGKVAPSEVTVAKLTFFSHQIINGALISSVNPATLRNPECLSEYEAIGRALRAEIASQLSDPASGG
jgi:acetoacetyl-CoA synthetase